MTTRDQADTRTGPAAPHSATGEQDADLDQADPRLARSRARLLDAATHLLATGGIDAVTVGAHPVLEGLTAEMLGAGFVHGYNTTPPGAEIVVSLPGDKAVVYVDRESTNGTILVHAGINFMNYIVEDTGVREMIPRLIAWIDSEARADAPVGAVS